MKRLLHNLLLLFAILTMSISASYGKIGDCPAIKQKGILYLSHSNYLEAVKINQVFDYDDKAREKIVETKENQQFYALDQIYYGKLLWHTGLFSEKYVGDYNPSLEEDVQWNISCIKEVTADTVIATDRRNRKFYVDKVTGKLLKTVKYGVKITNPTLDNENEVNQDEIKHQKEKKEIRETLYFIGLILLGVMGLIAFRKKS